MPCVQVSTCAGVFISQNSDLLRACSIPGYSDEIKTAVCLKELANVSKTPIIVFRKLPWRHAYLKASAEVHNKYSMHVRPRLRTSECLLEIACRYTDEPFWWAQHLLRHISPLLLLIAQLFGHLGAFLAKVSAPELNLLKMQHFWGRERVCCVLNFTQQLGSRCRPSQNCETGQSFEPTSIRSAD